MRINSMSCMPFLKFGQNRILALFFNARTKSSESFNMVFHNVCRSVFRAARCN